MLGIVYERLPSADVLVQNLIFISGTRSIRVSIICVQIRPDLGQTCLQCLVADNKVR